MLGLILSSVGVTAWLLMLELGQRVHDKVSLHRATDAAAYSAALVQARALNLHAYINRAQIGHQVAIAHLVSVSAAHHFRSKLGDQASKNNPPSGLIGAFFGLHHAKAYLSALSGGGNQNQSLDVFRDAFLAHEQNIHEVLMKVRTMQIKEFERQRSQVIERILISNIGESGSALKGASLAQLGVRYALTLDESKKMVVEQSAHDAYWRNFLSDLVGQYEFLTERKKIKRNFWIVHPRCPFRRHELRRNGKLRLGQNGHWFTEETLSFHALRYNKFIGCYHREYPMGWAMQTTQSLNSMFDQESLDLPNFSRQPFWRWARSQRGGGRNIFTKKGNVVGQIYARSSSVKWSSKGLGKYAQIDAKRAKKPIRIAINVTQKLSSGSIIHSISSAQTYFSTPQESARPKKGANIPSPARLNADEKGSLFEPYWRATLIPNLPRQ